MVVIETTSIMAKASGRAIFKFEAPGAAELTRASALLWKPARRTRPWPRRLPMRQVLEAPDTFVASLLAETAVLGIRDGKKRFPLVPKLQIVDQRIFPSPGNPFVPMWVGTGVSDTFRNMLY